MILEVIVIYQRESAGVTARAILSVCLTVCPSVEIWKMVYYGLWLVIKVEND